jgi:hypothetical protein
MNQYMQDGINYLECRNIFVEYVFGDQDVKDLVIEWLRNPERYANIQTYPKLNEQQLDYLADKLMDNNCSRNNFIRQLQSIKGENLMWITDFMKNIKNTFKKSCDC